MRLDPPELLERVDVREVSRVERDHLHRQLLQGAAQVELPVGEMPLQHRQGGPAVHARQRPGRRDGDVAAGGPAISVMNPLSRDHSVLRRELVSSLLAIVDGNLRQGIEDLAIFEVGKGYARDDDAPEGTREWWRLGIALAGRAEPPSLGRPDRPVGLDDGKGLIALVARRLGSGSPFQRNTIRRPAADEAPVGLVLTAPLPAANCYDVDGDGVGWRTLPGDGLPASFTRAQNGSNIGSKGDT